MHQLRRRGADVTRVEPGAAVVAAPARRTAAVAAFLYGAIIAAAIGHFLLGIPIQLTDSFGNMLKLATPWPELLASEFHQRSYFRPFLFAELKIVYDLSGGNYFAWFRGVHVAQIFALVLLYLGLVRPRTWRDAAVLPLGLAALFGIHTFKGTVVEAFPVNTFLTVVLCCLAAANLALMTHRWWVDALAALLFVVAALTVESGLLVGVIVIAAALAGARGVSKAGVAAVAVLFVGYFVLRFAILDVGSPGLVERSSGYGFRILDPDQLIERFGDNPWRFYAYNVITSALSVLFAEPRAGVFGLAHGITLGDPYPPAIVNVIASTCATALVAAYVWRRRAAWKTRAFSHDDRLVLLFVVVLAANAAISFPYTKDVIMSPAGAFFAVALFAAARDVLPGRLPPRAAAAVALLLLCATLGASWALRFAALPLSLRESARKVRNEWAYVEDWFDRQNIEVTSTQERALLRQLRNDAIYTHPSPPYLPLADHPWLDID
jgi:hypothetical protein